MFNGFVVLLYNNVLLTWSREVACQENKHEHLTTDNVTFLVHKVLKIHFSLVCIKVSVVHLFEVIFLFCTVVAVVMMADPVENSFQ